MDQLLLTLRRRALRRMSLRLGDAMLLSQRLSVLQIFTPSKDEATSYV